MISFTRSGDYTDECNCAAEEGRSGSDAGTAALLPLAGSTGAVCFRLGGFVHLRLRYWPHPLRSTPPLQICVVISADRQIFIASDKLHPASASAALPGFDLPFAKLSRAEFFSGFAAEYDLTPTDTTSVERVQSQHGGLKPRSTLGLRILMLRLRSRV